MNIKNKKLHEKLLSKFSLIDNSNKKFFKYVWLSPLIFFTQHNYFRDYHIYNKDIYVPNLIYKNRECIILSSGANWYWNDNIYRIDQHHMTLKGLNEFRKDYPKCRIILLHPDDSFIEGYPNYFEYILFNRNALIDTNSFYNLDNIERKYDAIYNSNFYRYKQHFLLEKITDLNIAFIYYHRTQTKNQVHYINNDEIKYGFKQEEKFREKPNFKLLNNINGKYQFLSKEYINKYYNQSFCGLCLSNIEGACLVSVEYLLSGLPVLSVKNKGGRDYFLTKMEEYAIVNVENDTQEIYDIIKHFKKMNYDKKTIRNMILRKIDDEWKNLFKQLDKVNIQIKDKEYFKKSLILAWSQYNL